LINHNAKRRGPAETGPNKKGNTMNNLIVTPNKPEIQEVPVTAAEHHGYMENFAFLLENPDIGDVNSPYMTHINPRSSIKHGVCSTCGYDRSTLKDWLSGADRDKSNEASEIISDCAECSKYFEMEDV
jgi:hypothetical protein